MTLAGLLMLAAGTLMIFVGGAFGWTFGLLYAAAGLDMLWFCLVGWKLRRAAR